MPSKPGADLGGPGNSLRAKRRSIQVKAIRAKAERGETTGKERAVVRIGAVNTRIVTGQEDLSQWDEEELRRGTRRDKNGGWVGRAPVVIPKAIHDELVRRTLANANKLMRENLEEAVKVLTVIVKDEDVDAKDRLRAIGMVMDRVMGKSPEKVEISGNSPWLVAINAGIVSMDIPNEDDEEDIEDAEWEEDEDV